MAGKIYQGNVTVSAGQTYNYTGDGTTQWRKFRAFKMCNGTLSVHFDQGPTLNCSRSIDYEAPFSTFQLTNVSARDVTIIFFLAEDGVDMNREHDILPCSTIFGAADKSCAAGAQTSLTTANPSTVAFNVQVAAGAAGPVRIGDIGVSATRGLWIYPGDMPTRLAFNGDLYCWNPQASAVTVVVLTETF